MPSLLPADESILVDETGLETGVFAQFHLKSAYQAIFAREGRHLSPFAVEGLVIPLIQGREQVPAGLFNYAARDDRAFVDRLSRTLHIRNFQHLDAPWLDLLFRSDAAANDDQEPGGGLEALGREIAAAGLDPARVVCAVGENAVSTPAEFASLAQRIRAVGLSLAIDDFGEGLSTVDRVYALKPDLVKLDGRWFRHLAEAPGGVRLLFGLVAGLQELGVRVVAEGIETPRQLDTALSAGVDCFQGFLLSRPVRAGAVAGFEPLSIQNLLATDRKIVPFRRIA